MGAITSSIGLISGIDSGTIINDLISLDSGPVNILNTEVKSAQNQQAAYKTLETQLSNIQSIGDNLALPLTFQNATTTSSNPNVLTATASAGAAVGTYQFQVAQLVSTQQSISSGFSDSTTAPVGAGTITLEQGGGEASSQTLLSQLNGGAGVSRGAFRITDRSGNSTVVDTSSDVTLDDVVKQINNSLGVSVQASVGKTGLVLTDQTGKTTANLTVQDLSGGTAAQSLGIAGTTTGTTITGTKINYLTSTTSLSQLNDGNGISTATASQSDFSVRLGDGSTINVQLNGSKTVGDVLSAINTAGGSKLKAALNTNGDGISLTDTSGGGGSLTLTALNGSTAASDLGLTGAATGSTLQGAPVLSGLDSVLVRTLNGGNGIALGKISIADKNGASGQIDLSSATSLSDIISAINNNTAGVKVSASINSAGTGIQITDNSGGAGSLVIGDVNSTSAAQLGIAGTFSNATQSVGGVNLQRKYISANTLLSTYNGGKGIAKGQFQITNSSGGSSTVDLSQGSFNNIGDVIQAINAKNIGVKASINATGNGLLLTDTSGGTGTLKVTDLGGTTASDLNIAGTATGTTLNGALQKTIAVSATDTLSTLQTKINQLGFGVTANIVNDGSSSTPYRLSLTSVNSGEAGRVLIDTGSTNLNERTLVTAQDAAVFYGGSGSSQPLLITSNKNQFTNVIKGVTVNLVSASTTPVTLSVTPDSTNVSTQLTSFVTDFNSIVSTIATDSNFNTTTNQGGILLGDGTTQQIQNSIYATLNTVVKGNSKYNSLASVGITVDTSSDPTKGTNIKFDANAFQAAFANDPAAVESLFSQATTGLGTAISNAMKQLTDPVNGVITLENNTLSTRVTQYQTQITTLNAILAQKKTQLQTEFNNMETTLAQLQSQSSIIAGLSGTTTTANKSNTSSSSGNSGSASSSSGTSSSTSTTGG